MSRWKIEEYFRCKKQEYGFEGIRLRTLKGQKGMNLFLSAVLGKLAGLVEEMDEKLLCIKIIERSKSLRNKVTFWLYQFSQGIQSILKYTQKGIRKRKEIERRDQYRQLQLKI